MLELIKRMEVHCESRDMACGFMELDELVLEWGVKGTCPFLEMRIAHKKRRNAPALFFCLPDKATAASGSTGLPWNMPGVVEQIRIQEQLPLPCLSHPLPSEQTC